MSIPDNQIINIEARITGVVASGGSSSRLTSWAFHFRRTSFTNPFDKVAFNTKFQSFIVANIAALLNIRWTQSANFIRILNDALDAPELFSEAAVGAIIGDSMSTIVSSYILLKSVNRGRHYRGSKHLFPLSESDTTVGTDDILNGAALARYATLETNLVAVMTDATPNSYVGSIFARSLSQTIINPTTIIATDIFSASTNKRLGHMRHRRVASVY